MKKLFASAIITVLFTTFLVSCNKSDDDDNTTSTPVATVMGSGAWTVSAFIDHGTNRTAEFTGYTFTFENAGYASAVLGSVVTNGTWATTTTANLERVQLDYGTTAPLSSLKNDWKVSGKSAVQVQMLDVDASGTVNYQLTISKIIR